MTLHDTTVNSLAPGRSWCDFENVIFNLALVIGIFKSSYDNVLKWMPQNLTVNIGSGNGLVPSGNKPLPEPMLTQSLVALWRHYAPMLMYRQHKPHQKSKSLTLYVLNCDPFHFPTLKHQGLMKFNPMIAKKSWYWYSHHCVWFWPDT